ncbi:hypothetical protein, partial [Paenibacillus campinasensis]|uniref:hypothetical protein n=1 Tax=Paenibacillus campinasensis TaxID=66347 RepID=UPI001C52A7EB
MYYNPPQMNSPVGTDELEVGKEQVVMGLRPGILSANAYDDYAYSLERSDYIWGFFHRLGPGEDFRDLQAGPVCRGDRGFQEDFRGHQDFR